MPVIDPALFVMSRLIYLSEADEFICPLMIPLLVIEAVDAVDFDEMGPEIDILPLISPPLLFIIVDELVPDISILPLISPPLSLTIVLDRAVADEIAFATTIALELP